MAASSAADRTEARRLLGLISERGFDRGRELLGDMDSLEAETTRLSG